MDAAPAQFHARLSALEEEDAMLRYLLAQQDGSHLQRCEQPCAVLQVEVAEYRRRGQEWQKQAEIVREPERRIVDPKSNNSPVETLRDRILEATATAANALLTVENFDQAVNTALRIIGQCLDADRIGIIETFEHSSGLSSPAWRILYEWDSTDTLSQISIPGFAQGSYEGIEEWYALLNQGQGISCLLEDMPEPFRSAMVEVGVKALHAVPIFVEGKLWGNVGFDDCREAKRRNSAELAVVKIAADCIGSAIERERIRQTLLRTQQERAAELAQVNEELRQHEHEVQRSYRLLSTVAEVTKDLLENPQIDGEYFGCVFFDDCIDDRQWSTQEIDVLTSGAGAIGAALHRKQLVDRLVEERIRVEQERAAELAKANEALARTSSRLAEPPDLSAFLNHLMIEAMAQVGADGGHVTIYDKQRDVISTSVLIEDGKTIQAPAFPPAMPVELVGFIQLIRQTRKLRYFDLDSNFEQDAHLFWTGVGEHHKRHKHVAGIAIPLYAGDEVLTTYDGDEDIYRGLQAGARGYLLKNVTRQELVEAIGRVHAGQKYIPVEVGARLAERMNNPQLTKRQRQVLLLLTEGKSNQEIAAALKVSEGTIKFHVNGIFRKLGVSDRTQAVLVALKRGITNL